MRFLLIHSTHIRRKVQKLTKWIDIFVCMWLSTEGTLMNEEQCNLLGMRSWEKLNKMWIVGTVTALEWWAYQQLMDIHVRDTLLTVPAGATKRARCFCCRQTSGCLQTEHCSCGLQREVHSRAKQKQQTDEGEKGADISSSTLATSSYLYLKKRSNQQQIFRTENKVMSKSTGSKNSWLTYHHAKG